MKRWDEGAADVLRVADSPRGEATPRIASGPEARRGGVSDRPAPAPPGTDDELCEVCDRAVAVHQLADWCERARCDAIWHAGSAGECPRCTPDPDRARDIEEDR